MFGEENTKIYISSANFMTHNTEKRVEIACPIYDENLKREILDYFEGLLKDNVKARRFKSDDNYIKINRSLDAYDSQAECIKKAISNVHTSEIKISWWKKIFKKVQS